MTTFAGPRRSRPAGRDDGFTLIELLVVILVIGVLSAIAIPVFLSQRQRAHETAVKADLKSTATALESFFAGYGTYPDTAWTFPGLELTVADKNSVFVCYAGDPAPTVSGANTSAPVFGVTASPATAFEVLAFHQATGRTYQYLSDGGGLKPGVFTTVNPDSNAATPCSSFGSGGAKYSKNGPRRGPGDPGGKL